MSEVRDRRVRPMRDPREPQMRQAISCNISSDSTESLNWST